MTVAPMTQGAWDVSSESMGKALVIEGKVHALRTQIAEDAAALEVDRAYVAMQTARLGACLSALAVDFDTVAAGALANGVHASYSALVALNATFIARVAALDSKRTAYATLTLGGGEEGALGYAACDASDRVSAACAAHYAGSATGTDAALLSSYHRAIEGQRTARYTLARYYDRKASQVQV